MDETLIEYFWLHLQQKGCKTIIYGNFCECKHCGDHAHFVKRGVMLKHNGNYSIYERVEVPLEDVCSIKMG